MISRHNAYLKVGEKVLPITEFSMQIDTPMSDQEAHELIKSINYHHSEAHPTMPTPEQIEEHLQARDRAIAKLQAAGKRVVLVKADFLEERGRYLCDDDEGYSEKFEPLPGTTVIEEEV